jgi:hypothetical protein
MADEPVADQPVSQLNTREFLARWHSVVEEHLVTELADILHQLALAGPVGNDLRPEQWATLGRHLAHALQEAGSPGGGVHAAMHYLHEAAVAHEEAPKST